MTDSPQLLPQGWVWTTLGEVSLDPQYGWTTKAVEDGSLHILRTTDITSGQIDWNSVPYCLDEPPVKEKYLLYDGDIVISRAGSVGFSHLIKNPKAAVFASYLIRFRPIINEQFFAYFLKSPVFWQAISEKSVGIALQNVNASKLRQIVIPIAPLPEQHRIVTKIEELFTQLDAGVASLKKVQAQLKRYRQAILKAAFEGRLTQEWREGQKGEIEPVDVLLKQIKGENKTGSKPNLERNCPLNTADLPNLPRGWIWVRIEDIAQVGTGATPLRTKLKYWEHGTIPWITSSAVNFSFVKDTDERITEIALKETKVKVNPIHTLLIALYGEGKTRGKVTELLIEACTNQALATVKLNYHNDTFRSYVKMVIQEQYFALRRCSSGGVQPNLNLSIIKRMVIPIPSFSEQNVIVSETERLFSIIDKEEKTIAMSLRQAETLRQSILKRAFEGKLVPQDSNDEPASILLERIKAEKSHHATEGKKGKTLQPKLPKRKLQNGN